MTVRYRPVQKISLTIRVDAGDLAAWQKRATISGVKTSEWIRKQCNEAVLFSGDPKEVAEEIAESAGSNGTKTDQDVPRVGGSAVPRRRTGAIGRRSLERTIDGIDQPSVSSDTTGLHRLEPLGSAVHLASSNRLTCSCPTCSTWRKMNGIPLGGMKARR